MDKRAFYSFGLIGFLALAALTHGADLHGRVVDRGTLRPDGSAKGISGVQVTLYDGRKAIGSATTNAKGVYRIRKVTAPRFRAIYQARGTFPAQASRVYALAPADTSSRDVYLDAAPAEKSPSGKGPHANAKGGYYEGLARGFIALARQESFFREDQEDSSGRISAYFDARDSSADYLGTLCELLWGEFLSQERPLETRYYLASELFPILDSLGWGRLQGMKRYLEVEPDAVREVANAMREAIRNPKKLPGPKEVRKAKAPLELASQIASEFLSDGDMTERSKDKFLARWKKVWGKETPSYREEGDEAAFKPSALLTKLASSKSQSPAVHFLRGKGLYAMRDYSGAADECGNANRLQGSYPAARHLEALAYIKMGREQEALGRFQALREAPDPYWKAKAFYGLGMLAEKEQRHSEAASNLWKAVRLSPEPEMIHLLASVSLKLNDRGEVEKLLQQRSAKGDHRAHYWLGRYAEEDQQTGVAEDHYRKAWDGSPAPEYAEALGRLYISREEYGPALAILEPLRAHLTPEGRLELAECLLQAGRSAEASKEYQAAYSSQPTPQTLLRYVEALVQSNRANEAIGIVNAFGDQNNPKVRYALAKANVGNHQPDKARPILEELVKREDNNADYHHLLGLCYFEDRNYSKAKREFDEALKYRQDHLEAIYYTGLCGVKLGRAEAARNYFNELAQRTSAEWKAKGLMGVGLSFAAQDKPDAAENFYQRSLGVLETAEAQALLALSKRRLGAPEKWVPLAKKAYELDNRQPKAVQAMGEALIAQGKKRDALRHFQEAVLNNPNSCDLLAGLAKSQYLTGSYQAGLTTSSTAIAICPQEPEPYYYAAVASDKLRNKKEAEDYFKAFRKAGGNADMLPEEYR
ncbi:MAG: repeat-containing protein [Fibrobacteres bacterium]|nr:repeat-containing protein [Fibrobacterota bacterium]